LSSKLLFFTNYKQISTAEDNWAKVAFVNALGVATNNLVFEGKLRRRRGKFDMVVVCTHTFVGA
jgi:hypothetical protein